ncbi:hypothetical protein GGQ22_02480 [Nocardioides sp. zg-579]|uniref:Uncharacterized protein n=1 Tax=Nocardioides marmotae TaxID=2663857 RepID=A0A6I3J9D2_9ACTN|nr:hypothetical protein [Nocardioides marmotae]MCR6030306.1 hypothetical protein [Gordonia jinghuaiqii]MTB93938.1 hypothetical protein [Nocardioides marmotae]QKE00254.1 hypothetical protein HPC71_03550 [Nocardioides marmotae]
MRSRLREGVGPWIISVLALLTASVVWWAVTEGDARVLPGPTRPGPTSAEDPAEDRAPDPADDPCFVITSAALSGWTGTDIDVPAGDGTAEDFRCNGVRDYEDPHAVEWRARPLFGSWADEVRVATVYEEDGRWVDLPGGQVLVHRGVALGDRYVTGLTRVGTGTVLEVEVTAVTFGVPDERADVPYSRMERIVTGIAGAYHSWAAAGS